MTSLRSYLKQLSAQTAMEYLLLFTVVATVVLISFKSFLPGMQNTSGGYYNSVTRVIMGENPEPIHGAWCDWVPRECPTGICGPSHQRRECACPPPQFGGNLCEGDAMRPCPRAGTCPVNGGWGSWSECVSGFSCWDYDRPEEPPLGVRTRECNSPPPSNGGLPCAGPASETCIIPACAPAQQVCEWGDYGSCQGDCKQYRLCECDPVYLVGPDGIEGTADDGVPTCVGAPPARPCPSCSVWPCEGAMTPGSVVCSGNEEFQVPEGTAWVHYDAQSSCSARKCEAVCQGGRVAAPDGSRCTTCGNGTCDGDDTCETCPDDCGECICAQESALMPAGMTCGGTSMYLSGFEATYQKFCEDKGYDSFAGCLGQDFPYEVSSTEFDGSNWIVRHHNDENNWLVTHISCFNNVCTGSTPNWSEERAKLPGGGCSGVAGYTIPDTWHHGGACLSMPTCSDGFRNQGETGVDCGGPCQACPTCSDGIPNQGETGVDCGGPCPACPASCPGTFRVWGEAPCATTWSIPGGTEGDVRNIPCDVSCVGSRSVECSSSGTWILTDTCTPGPATCSYNGFVSTRCGGMAVDVPQITEGTPKYVNCPGGCAGTVAFECTAGGASYTDNCIETATCSDNTQNQGETGVDCGGPCDPCPILCGAESINTGCGPLVVQGAYEGQMTWSSCPGECTGTGITGFCTNRGMEWTVDCVAPCKATSYADLTASCGAAVFLPDGDPGDIVSPGCPGNCTGSLSFECNNGWRTTGPHTCAVTCGNGTCDAGEDCTKCPGDCNIASEGAIGPCGSQGCSANTKPVQTTYACTGPAGVSCETSDCPQSAPDVYGSWTAPQSDTYSSWNPLINPTVVAGSCLFDAPEDTCHRVSGDKYRSFVCGRDDCIDSWGRITTWNPSCNSGNSCTDIQCTDNYAESTAEYQSRQVRCYNFGDDTCDLNPLISYTCANGENKTCRDVNYSQGIRTVTCNP